MSAEENAALVRRYFAECVSPASSPDPSRALSLVDELLTEDFVMFFNDDTEADAARGRDEHKRFLIGHAEHFPDDDWTVEALFADDEGAACRWHFLGTHAGTGNPIDVRAADFYRIRDGRLAEFRRFLDFRSLDHQRRPQRGQG